MLALSHQQGLLPYTVCMVAALSVQEVLLEVPIQKCQDEIQNSKQTRMQWSQTRRKWAGVGNSLLLGICGYLLTFSLLVSVNCVLICTSLLEFGHYYNILSICVLVNAHVHTLSLSLSQTTHELG